MPCPYERIESDVLLDLLRHRRRQPTQPSRQIIGEIWNASAKIGV